MQNYLSYLIIQQLTAFLEVVHR